jgi:SAM-dependent methyltransferase
VSPETRTHGPLAYGWVLCNQCGRDVTRNLHGISRLVQCVGCGLIYVNPRPSPEDLATQYQAGYFHCDEPTFGGYENYEADREEILRTFRRRIALLMPWCRAAAPRLLDVGCATGLFLEVARDAGWRVEGIDISEYALARARERGFAVSRGTLPSATLESGGYDVVTLWDVIEHVPDPAAVIAECHRLLRPGGVLAMSTPDAGSPPAKWLKGRWLGFRSIDEHLYFFSRASMRALLARGGFRVERFQSVGKDLSLPRLIARMRFYSKIASVVLRAADRLVPDLRIYLNPHDTMCVIAIRDDRAAVPA